jgi:hypothetical protein
MPWVWVSIGFFLVAVVVRWLVLGYGEDGSGSGSDAGAVVDDVSVVAQVAQSYGVPVVPMERLADFLQENDFAGRYGGVGLFAIKPSHREWLRGSVLAGADVDLTDDVQNAVVAAWLLRRFRRAGYSWESSFVIYVYGFAALHEPEKVQGLIGYLFGGVE